MCAFQMMQVDKKNASYQATDPSKRSVVPIAIWLAPFWATIHARSRPTTTMASYVEATTIKARCGEAHHHHQG
jgi:hypothetical protein